MPPHWILSGEPGEELVGKLAKEAEIVGEEEMVKGVAGKSSKGIERMERVMMGSGVVGRM